MVGLFDLLCVLFPHNLVSGRFTVSKYKLIWCHYNEMFFTISSKGRFQEMMHQYITSKCLIFGRLWCYPCPISSSSLGSDSCYYIIMHLCCCYFLISLFFLFLVTSVSIVPCISCHHIHHAMFLPLTYTFICVYNSFIPIFPHTL